MASNITNHLNNLRATVTAGNASVIVGAGLSKNVSNQYLLWSDLLRDIVVELFGAKIKMDYESIKHIPNVPDEATYIDDQIKFVIAERGYVGIVTDYVKRLGYPEAIASYIEERTPFAKRENGKLILTRPQNGQILKTELPEDLLSLHSKLISLPWNNIYTTNYDNLLEICIDSKIEGKIREEIRKSEGDILKLQTEKEDVRSDLDRCIREQEIQTTQDREEDAGPEGAELMTLEPEERHFAADKSNQIYNDWKLQSKIEHLQRRLMNMEEQILMRTDQLTEFQHRLDECYSVVIHSSELGLKRHKNIIKLHGSLRENPDSHFEFDGDLRSHYIISQEDYDTYPTKHEAFTQLMRISLLQQSFCLIGFSGADPNFLAWVSWVRDIIQRRPGSDRNGGHPIKVYMIDLSEGMPPQARSLFFSNHRIVHIPLQHDEVVTFLSEHARRTLNKSDCKELLNAFLDYVNAGKKPDGAVAAVELLHKRDYQAYWDKIKLQDVSRLDIQELLENDIPSHLKSLNRIPSIGAGNSHKKELLLRWAFTLLKEPDQCNRNKLANIVAWAMRDYFVPASIFESGEKNVLDVIEELKEGGQEFDDYFVLLLRDTVWRNNITKAQEIMSRKAKELSDPNNILADEIKFQSATLAAFNLRFNDLKEIIDGWDAKEHWSLKKAGFQSLFDPNLAYKNMLATAPLQSLQEQFYKLHLLRFLSQSNNLRVPTEISTRIKSFTREGIRSIDENLDHLIEKITNASRTVEPYGSDRFRFGAFTISGESPTLQSLQFFGILSESGFPISAGNVALYSHKRIYPIVRLSFEWIPFPVLFYTLQYSNEKLLRRVGQDYACSEKLAGQLGAISDNLIRAWSSDATPNHIKENILNFYSELLIALASHTWIAFFMKVWAEKMRQQKLFDQRYLNSNPFLLNGLKYLPNDSHVAEVMADCLRALKEPSKADFVISFLYRLARNPLLRDHDSFTDKKDLMSLIEETIASVSQPYIPAIFALGNIGELLDEQQQRKIRAQLLNTDFSKISSDRVWRIIMFFAKGDETIITRVKEAIVQDPKLWNSNITETQATSRVEYITISRLRRKESNPHGIVWSAPEVLAIYAKLKIEIKKIETFLKKRPEVTQYEFILREMLYFLKDESALLAGESDFETVLTSAEELFCKQVGFKSVEEALISVEQSQVLLGLEEISIQLYDHNTITEQIPMLDLVVKKLIFQAQPALSESLSYISQWFFDFKDEEVLRAFEPSILNILHKYHKSPPDGIETPFLEEKLVKLAVVLNEWKNSDDDIILHYMSKAVTGRFINLRTLNAEG